MQTIITMNKASSGSVKTNAVNMRVRVSGNKLQIKPTFRTCLVNLPKGESLVPLETVGGSVHKKRARLILNSENQSVLKSFTGGKNYEIEPQKYGWLTLNPVDKLEGRPGVRVGIAN